MNLILRVANRGRAVVLPVCVWVLAGTCVLALAGTARAETLTPAEALAGWEASGRAQGLARPDTPCQDFLQTLGKKPDYFEYLGCEQDDASYIQPMQARYRVSGAAAVQAEAYLARAFGMPPLVFICCGWSTGRPFYWRAGPDSVSYEIGMGVETPSYPREQWHKIPSFGVSVGVIRKSP